ncbi:MAG: hypothetical protein ACON4F_00435 [Candidatus Puniceispirillaceae bacterium]
MTKNPPMYKMSQSATQDPEMAASKSAVEPKGAQPIGQPDAACGLSPARAALMAAVDAQTQWRLKTLSLALGCNHAYLQQYVKRASPRYLPEHIRLRLCQLLQLPADALREEMPKTSRTEYEGVREAQPPASPLAASYQIARLQMRDLHRDLHPYITAEMLGDGLPKPCPFYLGDEPADDLRLWQIPAGHRYQDSNMPAVSGGDRVVVRLIKPKVAEYGPSEYEAAEYRPSEDRPSEDRKALYLIFDGRQLCLKELDGTDPHKNTPSARDYMYIIGRAVALWRDFS